MSRPSEPGIKTELLEKCFKAAVKKGTLEFSINELGEKIGSSGRMLVYHFGSKKALDQRIVELLETRLRQELSDIPDSEKSQERFLLRFWEHLTTNRKIAPLLKLMLEVASRSAGNPAMQGLMEKEMANWLALVKSNLRTDDETTLCIMHLLQGALLDFLVTGEATRGRRSIVKILSKFKLRDA